MICKNCGSEILFQNGIGVCSACNTQIKLDGAYENADVYICYTDTDFMGRRVKDSFVANELYNKLESAKIKTFYQRVSAKGLVDEELEIIDYQSLYNAKVVIIVATSYEHFDNLYKKYSQHFENKKILPVCVDVLPSQMPQQLSKYQAANYNSVGSDADIINNVLTALDRDFEIELNEIMTKAQKRKKNIIIASIIAIAVAILAVAAFFVFKNLNNSDDKTNEKSYNEAMQFLEQEKYLDAAEIFVSLGDYKDSASQLKIIYDRYDGYYQNEQQAFAFYLNIIDGKNAQFSFERTINNKTLKISDSLRVVDNSISGTYVDNLFNEGDITITLSDDKIKVSITTTKQNADISMGSVETEFLIANKTDRPSLKTVPKDLLLSWLTNTTYISDVRTAGYELEYIDYTSPYDAPLGKHYKITNSDVTIIAADENLVSAGNDYELVNNMQEDVVVAVIAPIELVLPEKIGQSTCAYLEDDIVYVPNSTYLFFSSVPEEYGGSYEQTFIDCPVSAHSKNGFVVSGTLEETIIKFDSMVAVTSQKTLGEKCCDAIIKSNNLHYYKTLVIERFYSENPNIDSYQRTIDIKTLAQNETAFLFCVHEKKADGWTTTDEGTYNYYEFDLTTNECSFIAKEKQVSYINSYGSRTFSYDSWKNISEIAEKFDPNFKESNNEELGDINTEIDKHLDLNKNLGEDIKGTHYTKDGTGFLQAASTEDKYDIYTFSIYLPSELDISGQMYYNVKAGCFELMENFEDESEYFGIISIGDDGNFELYISYYSEDNLSQSATYVFINENVQ